MIAMWSKGISRYRLFNDLKYLGYGNGPDLPLDLCVDLPAPIPVYQRDRTTLVGCLNMKILPSNGHKHRVYVQCDKCGEWVPFGRYHQHWSKADHR